MTPRWVWWIVVIACIAVLQVCWIAHMDKKRQKKQKLVDPPNMLRLPLCGLDGCGKVATRGEYRIVVEGTDAGPIRFCHEHERGLRVGPSTDDEALRK